MASLTLFGAAGIKFIHIITIYYTGALIVSTILLIITIKKNRFEGEYQLYSRILDARTKLQNTKYLPIWLKRARCMPRDLK